MAHPYPSRTSNGVMSPSSDNNVPGHGRQLFPNIWRAGHGSGIGSGLPRYRHWQSECYQASQLESFDSQLNLSGFI